MNIIGKLSFMFFCLNCYHSISQSAFIVDELGSIYNVNISNCTFTSVCINTNLQSIAYYNGYIYGTSTVGSTNSISQLDMTTCNKTTINSATPSSDINALVSDGTGCLYAAESGGGNIYKYSIPLDSWTVVGSVAPNSSAGDLTFYNGKLYLVALGTPNKLVEISLNPFSYSVIGDIGTTTDVIYGIITSFPDGSCTGSVYAMVQNGMNASIGIVNPLTGSVSSLCPNLFSGTIYDATSTQESGGLSLSLSATPDSICVGDSTILNAQAGFMSYVWSGSGLQSTTGISVVATPPTTTTYSVTATDSSGLCSNSAQVTILVNPPPDIQASSVTVCPGYSSLLIASGANSYLWSNSLGVNDSVTTPPLFSNATYSVTGTSLGCSASATVNVNVTQFNDDFSFSPSTPFVNMPVTFSPFATNGTQWSWSFGNGLSSFVSHPITTYTEPGVYEVMLISSSGTCNDTIIKHIEVFPETSVFVPNVFTPNGDGINDLFGPVLSGQENFEMVIFNRWGKQVFETNSMDMLWDGTVENGRLAAEGVYYYSIIIGQFLNDDLILSGSVSLYRNQ